MGEIEEVKGFFTDDDDEKSTIFIGNPVLNNDSQLSSEQNIHSRIWQ